MRERLVARRYAEALYKLGREEGVLDELEKDLKEVISAIAENNELKKIVEHQLLPPDEKQRVFKKVFTDRINLLTLRFLLLVIQKKREYYLNDIYTEFLNIYDEFRGIENAIVTSAVELSAEDQKALQEKLERITEKKIRLELKVDPDLIGGLIVKIGDRIIDGSVKTRLKSLKQHLREAELA